MGKLGLPPFEFTKFTCVHKGDNLGHSDVGIDSLDALESVQPTRMLPVRRMVILRNGVKKHLVSGVNLPCAILVDLDQLLLHQSTRPLDLEDAVLADQLIVLGDHLEAAPTGFERLETRRFGLVLAVVKHLHILTLGLLL